MTLQSSSNKSIFSKASTDENTEILTKYFFFLNYETEINALPVNTIMWIFFNCYTFFR